MRKETRGMNEEHEEKNHMHDSTKTGLAFLIGTVVGGVAALLMAPDKGSQTRQKLRLRAKEGYEKGQHAIGHARETVEEKASKVMDAAEKNKDAIKEAAGEAKAAYKREMAQPAEK